MSEQMYEIELTSQFKKGLKRIKKQGRDPTKLEQVIDILAQGELLPEKYHDHELTGNWARHRECHVEPDWLLIYFYRDDVLVLTLAATGSHSDLF